MIRKGRGGGSTRLPTEQVKGRAMDGASDPDQHPLMNHPPPIWQSLHATRATPLAEDLI